MRVVTITRPRAYEVRVTHADGTERSLCAVFRGSDRTGRWSPTRADVAAFRDREIREAEARGEAVAREYLQR